MNTSSDTARRKPEGKTKRLRGRRTRRLLVEIVILHSARTQSETGKALKEAAQHYKVDTDAIAQKG